MDVLEGRVWASGLCHTLRTPQVCQGLRTQTCPTFTLVIPKNWGHKGKKVTARRPLSSHCPAQLPWTPPPPPLMPSRPLPPNQVALLRPSGAGLSKTTPYRPTATSICPSFCHTRRQTHIQMHSVHTQTLSPQSRPLPRKSQMLDKRHLFSAGLPGSREPCPPTGCDSPGPH